MPNSISQNNNYIESILFIITQENKKPIPIGIILKKLTFLLHKPINKNIFFENIEYLIKTYQIVKLKNNKIVLGYPKAEVDESKIFFGTISINSKLSGFITKDFDQKANYFVHWTNLNGALNGDKVKFALLKINNELNSLKDAVVLEVVNHNKNFFVGCYTKTNDSYEVICDDKKMYLPIKLDDTSNLIDGTKILFDIVEYRKDYCLAKIVKIIGHKFDVGVDILSIAYDNGAIVDFAQKTIDEANQIELNIDDEQKKIRKDLTNLNIITIDPASSKDFDDAFCVKKIDHNTYKLYVCIADVSNYVKWESNLDKVACNRGCSIYLVDRVIPMLPHNLSNDICSLNPNVPRLAITCEIDLDLNGKIKKIDVYPSIIKSHHRFNYDEVQRFFLNNSIITDQEMKKMLLDSYNLHKILDKRKQERGYIDFNLCEPKIIVNEKCQPIEIQLKKQNDAQKMVEDFMLVANEAVAIYGIKHKLPFIYRVHDFPQEDKFSLFNIELKKLNLTQFSVQKDTKSKTIAQWLKVNKDNENIDLVNFLLLRLMAKAKYSPKNIGHYGLALENYTHFTSPIRRYSDLLIHHIFWMYLFAKEKYTDDQRAKLSEKLISLCELINKKEIIAIQTERDVNSCKFAQYMENHIGETFIGKVINVSSFGLFIELPNTIEGIIKLANLKNDFYVYNPETYQMIGKNTKQIFTLGTKVKVKCIFANKYEKKIEFELIEKI